MNKKLALLLLIIIVSSCSKNFDRREDYLGHYQFDVKVHYQKLPSTDTHDSYTIDGTITKYVDPNIIEIAFPGYFEDTFSFRARLYEDGFLKGYKMKKGNVGIGEFTDKSNLTYRYIDHVSGDTLSYFIKASKK